MTLRTTDGQRLFDVIRSRQQCPTKVYGREEELELIKRAFDRVSDPNSVSSELVLVQGASGCGKSSLVKAAVQWMKNKRRKELNVFYGAGKYDQLVNNEPFAAIMTASNELCKQLLNGGPAMVQKFNKAFCGGSIQEAKMLSEAIPYLASLIGQSHSNSGQYSSLTQAFTRFKQLWRSFLFSLSSCADVTVLFLDDVQWADSNSLDLINSLMSMTRARNILLICACRDDASVEKSQQQRLHWCFSIGKGATSYAQRRRSNEKDYKQVSVPRTEIEMKNLDPDATKKLVAGLLYGDETELMEEHSIQELSKVTFSHTSGNPFFTLHYLHHLSCTGLLRTEDYGMKWKWELCAIANQAHIPESVAELLAEVVSVLPDETRSILTTAAHVGFQFSSTLLDQDSLLNVSQFDQVPGSHKKMTRRPSSGAFISGRVQTVLDVAVREGLLERKGTRLYTFPHDQVQQTLYDTLADNPNRQQRIHLEIGRALLQMVEEAQNSHSSDMQSCTSGTQDNEGNDVTLFMAVDNLNKGSLHIHNEGERHQLIILNYEAAQAALRKSAVEGAVQYTRSAIKLLGEDRWDSHYYVTLDIYSLATRLEHSTGNIMGCLSILSEIQQHGRTIYDKLPAYFTEIDTLGARGDMKSAMELGIVVLQQLGERMSSKPSFLNVLLEFNKASAMMKKTAVQGFLTLPPMKDPAKVAAMSVLQTLFLYSYLSGLKNKNLTAICMLRMLNISSVHGLSKHTPFGLASYATVQTALGDFSGARETVKLTFDLVDVVEGAAASMGRTGLTIHALISPWLGQTAQEIQPEYLRLFQSCRAIGDIDFGYYGVLNHLWFEFFRGAPLDELDAEFEKYVSEMEEFQVHHAKHMTLCTWRIVRALLDLNSAKSLVIAPNVDDDLHSASLNEVLYMSDIGCTVATGLIFGNFGEHEVDMQNFRRLGKCLDAGQMHFTRPFYQSTYALACFELHSRTGKGHYRRVGRRAMQFLERFYKENSSIAIAPYKLLIAEYLYANVDKKRRKSAESLRKIEEAFLDAAGAARSGTPYFYMEARCFERLSAVAGLRGDGKNQAIAHRTKAINLYRNWGAIAKLELLENT